MSNANEPAPSVAKTNWPNSTNYKNYVFGGLTKREYFAAMAMQGLCTRMSIPTIAIAEISTKIADALIAELEKQP